MGRSLCIGTENICCKLSVLELMAYSLQIYI